MQSHQEDEGTGMLKTVRKLSIVMAAGVEGGVSAGRWLNEDDDDAKRRAEPWIRGVQVGIATFLALAGLLASVGVAGGMHWLRENGQGIWSSDVDHRDIEEYFGTRFCAIFGLACIWASFVSYILHLRVKKLPRKQLLEHIFFFFMTIGFFSTLLAVWIWGDLMSHMQELYGRRPSVRLFSKKLQVFHTKFRDEDPEKSRRRGRGGNRLDEQWQLGWAYWITVSGCISCFCANLLYFMRNDCDSDNCARLAHSDPATPPLSPPPISIDPVTHFPLASQAHVNHMFVRL